MQTPALTNQRVSDMIASLLEEHLCSNSRPVIQRRNTRWMCRTEQARFYYHRARKVLPELKNRRRL
jgi:hypothetical protein